MKITGDRISLTILILVVCALVVPAADAQSSGRKNFLWKVRSGTATVYLLGSLHVMREEMYPLNSPIEEAFEKSNVLAVEANINDLNRMDIERFMERAFYPAHDSLKNHLSRETYELIRREAGDSPMLLALMDKQRPWFLALSLTSIELVKRGYDPRHGIDVHFLTKAQGRKKVVELESIDYQIDLLSNFPDDEQEAFLLSSLREVKSIDQEADKMFAAWKSGDAKTVQDALARSTAEDERMVRVSEKLIDGRNKTMAAKIEDYLKGRNTCFVVVGAGHLVGNSGIVDLLKRRGYVIEQL